MDSTEGPLPETVTARLGLSVAGKSVRVEITVPTGAVRLEEMLPVLHSLTDVVVGAAVEAHGGTVSCRAGCGACCRQLVPIAEPEARRIRDLVDALPEPRRSRVRGRFAAAREVLERAGMLEALRQPEAWEPGASRGIGLDYFARQVACPFLEEESCSIHAERPMACREYLVTSPAEHCARPSAESVACVPMPRSVWGAVGRVDPADPSDRTLRWVPLVLALDWAEAHPGEVPARPAPELLGLCLERLTGRGCAESDRDGSPGRD